MRILNYQNLLDLKDGAAIFSSGGGGSPEAGQRIVDDLVSEGYAVRLVAPSKVPSNARVVNFACVGATTAIEYDPAAAVRTLKALEEYAAFSTYATIPVELGGFNTLVAVDVAARCGVPVVDGDGAGRSVPEVHLKVYTIDDIPMAPMVVSDTHAKNMIIIREALDFKACERMTRLLATEWNQSAYTARRILTGSQVRTSPIQLSLTRSIRIGELLRKSEKPIETLLEETGGLKLFEGAVIFVERKTESGFTSIDIEIKGMYQYDGSTLKLKVKNEVLVAYRDGSLAAMAPDIITPLHFKTGKCITAERIKEGDHLLVLGLLAPQKWKTSEGLELWKDVLERAGVMESYVAIERLARA
ncbi:MAG: DUF917 domain-containing protein [Candidatus Bathyarchaeota archaeon]|nr:DUF917 domain-containing protein [Candidatus Bathyarchaeota archaeon]